MVRAQAIAGGLVAVAHAEHIVKDLMGERAVVTSLFQHGHEFIHLKLALAGETAVVAAP